MLVLHSVHYMNILVSEAKTYGFSDFVIICRMNLVITSVCLYYNLIMNALKYYNASDAPQLPVFVHNPLLLAKDVKHVLTHRILLAVWCPLHPFQFILVFYLMSVSLLFQ